MTDTEISSLIAELSTSDTFPAFESASKALLNNRVNGHNANSTPESISVAAKLYSMTDEMSSSEAGAYIGRVISAVDPKQGNSLWGSMIEDVSRRKRLESLQDSRQLVIALRVMYGMSANPGSNYYDIMKMTDDDFIEHIQYSRSVSHDKVESERYRAEIAAKFPPEPQ